MKPLICFILTLSVLTGCGVKEQSEKLDVEVKEDHNESIVATQEVKPRIAIINEDGVVLAERFNVPRGYKRVEAQEGSFAQYLRNLELKPHGSKVLFYNGNTKENYGVYEAVANMDIGKKNLQQCADAIMRLRGEYFYSKGMYDKIHFNFTNGFKVDYSKWVEGYRVKIDGNNTRYIKKNKKSNTYNDFRNYMELIFMYAGTMSLSDELETVALEDMQIGDVFIQGGSPGHAVIVVDMARGIKSDKKLFMLAQSYMPAQDIQILANPNDDMSPWYSLEDVETIATPEWTFNKKDLKRFK